MPLVKTPCPVSRSQFRSKAPVGLPITIDGHATVAEIKEFSTGSLGWFFNGKTTVVVDGVRVPCQVSVQVTLVNSKDLPQ
jgi:hypothetical protein